MQDAGALAKSYFQEGYSCAEAVLKSVAQIKGINSPLIPKIATAFGSGLSRTDGMCGALSGGYLALSMCQGRTLPSDDRSQLYENVATLQKLFEKRFCSTHCSTLLGFSLSEKDGGEKFKTNHCKEEKCFHFVECVSNEVIKMLDCLPKK